MTLGRRSSSSGAYVYHDYRNNHVIWPGSEKELDRFVGKSYGNLKGHKLKHAKSSNSEDALTWSCFDALRQIGSHARAIALEELWELAYDGRISCPNGVKNGRIEIGNSYEARAESTEVDLSIEGPGALVFFEAKLYSAISLPDPDARKPHDQIGRKLRIGSSYAADAGQEFFFVLLDLAPAQGLRNLKPKHGERQRSGFAGKWRTAESYLGYKRDLEVLREVLGDDDKTEPRAVANNMGWLTWADVFKSVLRAAIADRKDR